MSVTCTGTCVLLPQAPPCRPHNLSLVWGHGGQERVPLVVVDFMLRA